MDNLFNYFTRVNFTENDLRDILEIIRSKYHFTQISSYKVIETGYEDFNVFDKDQINKYYKIYEIVKENCD